MPYLLVAIHRSPEWEGEIARESFEDLPDAEQRMAHWARFGVDSFCNTPTELWIVRDEAIPVRMWDWRTRASVEVVVSEDKSGKVE